MVNIQAGKVLSDVLRRRSVVSHRIFRRALSDESKEWIPPSRPLSGDKGKSHLYEGMNEKIQNTTSVVPDDIREMIMGDENSNETVDYIDIDEVDFAKMQELFDANQVEMNDNIVEEDLTMEELMAQLDAMDGDDDEDDEDEDFVDQSTMSGTEFNNVEGVEDEGDDDDDDFKPTKEEMDFVIDKFQQHFENKDFLEPNFLKQEEEETQPEAPGVPDWLSTRRAKLNNSKPAAMLSPAEFKSKRKEDLSSDIPVIKHTLLSSKEIMKCLVNLGGQNVNLVTPEEELQTYLGWKGLIIATGTSYSHIRVLADAVVHNLRVRDLAERGVIGAKFGSEGGEDPSMSARARRKRNIGRGKKTNDGWMVVDCRNYIVHIQDEDTRKGLDLETLWGADSEEGRKIRNLNMNDDDEVDDFVAMNPVPDDYTRSIVSNDEFWTDGKYRGGYGNNSLKESGRWAPSSNKRAKMKNRGRRR